MYFVSCGEKINTKPTNKLTSIPDGLTDEPTD